MLFIVVFPAWEVLWFVCLFPHHRCYLLYPLYILLGLLLAREVLFVVTSCKSLHCSGFFSISISLRFCRYLVYQFVLFLITGVLSHCYTFSLKLLLCFSFPGMRSSLVCLFVSSWAMLCIAFPLHFACFVFGSRSFSCCRTQKLQKKTFRELAECRLHWITYKKQTSNKIITQAYHSRYTENYQVRPKSLQT